MRLTLRTLLAYLDDTLEPAKAKEIGQKVAESDAARELVERLKQVTRRRRLAAPPASGGASKLDPNTIAEYLDNEVSPETAAEVEAICLATDVHLAEVAACHQILTLVLGEPLSPPPTAKQRMYGLVKGPEAIPFRKPPAPPVKEPATVAVGREVDDTLRLGLPPVGAKGSLTGKLLLFGGGFIAACLLIVAVWQVLNLGGTKEETPKDVVKIDDKERHADKDDKEKDKTGDKKEKETPEKEKRDDKEKEKTGGKEKEKEGESPKKEKGETKEAPRFEDIAFAEPDMKSLEVIGRYQSDEPKDSILCLLETEPKKWKRLKNADGEVKTAQAILSMPGSWSTLYLPRGLRLTLCGNMPEISPLPIFESKVTLHRHDKLDLDLTLQRGQFLITSLKDKPMQIRVRFANPFFPDKPEHYDVLLHSKGTEILFGLNSFLTEPFIADKDDRRRKGPVNIAVCVLLKGYANIRFGDVTYGVSPVNQLIWSSIDGPRPPVPITDAGFAAQEPPFDEKLDAKTKKVLVDYREAMKKARASLGHRVTGDVRVGLAEVLDSTEPKKRLDPKVDGLTKIMLARLTVRAMAALGDQQNISDLLELLDPPMNDVVRPTARDALVSWVSAERDNDYVLYKLLDEKYRTLQADKIMKLIHGLSPKELSEPVTYEYLIDSLDDRSNPVIREFAAFRLYGAVPTNIPYSAWDTSEERQRAVAAWRTLIPPGSLPPRPKKGDKGKG
ncbi:MAG: hypothetical protein U0793_33455 [Gemmataceae bacterium]